LLCHALDTAATTEAFVDRVVPEPVLGAIAADLGLTPGGTRSWLTYLCGLHDLGKASPAFQWRVLPGVLDHRDRLSAAQLDDPGRGFGSSTVSHGALTGQFLVEELVQRGVGRPQAVVIATVIGGHHGVPFRTAPSGTAQAGGPTWADARAELIGHTAEFVGLGEGVPTRISWIGALLLAGIVSVCDWIASDETVFKYAGDAGALDPVGYGRRARSRAQTALSRLEWSGWHPGHAPVSFSSSFGFEPRPLQSAVEQLSLNVTGPALALVEAPTGEGKTEAALHLADRWANASGYRGLYFALPTQATSNQMLGRMRDWLARRYPTELVALALLHANRELNADFAELLELGREQAATVDLEPAQLEAASSDRPLAGAVVATDWFTRRKRGLLAPFGVGTVDQALIGVLAAPHAFVRLLGLAGKVVILDEVHAYDAYSFALIEQLLGYLAASGSSVIVLSATLPDARRRALLASFMQGLVATSGGLDSGDAQTTIDGSGAPAYPRLSWASATGGGAATLEVSRAARRTIRVVWAGDPRRDESLIDDLLDAARQGGKVGLVANTVSGAQAIFGNLRARAAERGDPTLVELFHARFPLAARLEREGRCVKRYGSSAARDGGSVLVATQVIEQSLDLDFDLLLSDLAPIDLLLQRAGRLQRNRRNDASRPRSLRQPTLLVVQPDQGDDGLPRHDRGSAAVYDPHLLDRTLLALEHLIAESDGYLRVPDDVSSLVEAVYAETGPPDGLSPPWQRRWLDGASASRAMLKDAMTLAAIRRLPAPGGSRLPDPVAFYHHPGDDDEFAIATRLGTDSITVAILEGDPAHPRIGASALDLARTRRLPAGLAREAVLRTVALSAGSRQGKISPQGRELIRIDIPPTFAATPGLARARPLFRGAGGRLLRPDAIELRWTGIDDELGIRSLRP
jgi:CRISPR-associated endonuclease/helicase Cas3